MVAPKLDEYKDVSIFATTPAYLANRFESFSNLLETARKNPRDKAKEIQLV